MRDPVKYPTLHPFTLKLHMKNIYAAILVLGTITSAHGQGCGEGRYQTEQFTSVTEVLGVTFGSNTAVTGGAQTLKMDVYMPTGDVLVDRPVILVAFGGSFIGGTRSDVADLCRTFAKMGYVAVANDYRVGFFFPNATTTTRAVMRGAHDMKACIRYLRKSVAELDNPYGIDPDRIIAGGVSAGAISAIHATYLDQESELPPVLAAESVAIGGVEGNSGNPGYSSAVLACMSMSGAIGDTLWVNAGDPPLVSVHDVGDGVVPYYTQEVSVIGIATGLVASGSYDLHQRCTHLGMPNCLLPYPGTGHVAYLTSDPVGSVGFVATFCGQLVCNEATTCGNLTTAVKAIQEEGTFNVFPNPTSGLLQFTLPTASEIRLLDVSGRVVMQLNAMSGIQHLDLSSLPDGLYTLFVQGATNEVVKVVKGL